MRFAEPLQSLRSYLLKCAAIIAVIFLSTTGCAAQSGPAVEPPLAPWIQELQSNLELQAELSKLIERLQHDLQYPPPWSASSLLPLLPESTMIYAAIPNYGDVTHQAVTILRQELDLNSALRNWRQHGPLTPAGP
jgi:hypothetical protein